jgi:sugar/nucleoside kinase (ribokinase family)
MSVVVVGSIALDTVRTPFGRRREALGGSAVYFSTAARFFTDVSLVGVVGKDFPAEHRRFLAGRGIDLSGLRTAEGKTFRWTGAYEYDLNEAKTLDTRLNVFADFCPVLTPAQTRADAVFLANIDPDLQLNVLSQVARPRLVAADTMNLWIKMKPKSLKKLCRRLDILVLNDAEARQFSGRVGLIQAGRLIQTWGPRHVVIKKGEHGVLLFSGRNIFTVPAYPLEDVFDPTGAGDTFAGGLIGYINHAGNRLDEDTLRRALYHGTVMASFTVEDFSIDRLKTLRPSEIRRRLADLHRVASLERF